MKDALFKGKNGPLLIAEIGGNHEGNFLYAKKLTQLAIESESDCVKFQLYSGDTLVNKIIDSDRNQHFKKFELKKEEYIELAEMVNNAGKIFMASVWDKDMIDWIDDYSKIYKVGSGDMTAYPILKEIALKRKPIILSTGLSSEQEVVESVKYLQSIDSLYLNPNFLAVLQCTSMYPISDSDANLNVIKRYKELFNVSIGYSDHTKGSEALEYAYLVGADILEFHFTDNRENKKFRDHKVSLTLDEVRLLSERINKINVFLGNREKKSTDIEKKNNHHISFRRAVYPLRDLPKGHVIRAEDLVVLRPLKGLDARDFDQIIGSETLEDIKAYDEMSYEKIKVLKL